MGLIISKTPGRAAHDAFCELDDWDELDAETRALWEDVAQAGHAVIMARER